jgi:integrase
MMSLIDEIYSRIKSIALEMFNICSLISKNEEESERQAQLMREEFLRRLAEVEARSKKSQTAHLTMRKECEEREIIIDKTAIETAFNIIYKEKRKMPKRLIEIFDKEWLEKHTRNRSNNLLEIRCTVEGLNISGSGRTIEIAAENFVRSMINAKNNKAEKETKKVQKNVPFCVFAENWFAVVKKPNVAPNTYDSFFSVYSIHIKPFFKGKDVKDITAMQIQPLFNGLVEAKKFKTTQVVKFLLNGIFKSAIGERIITFNPMDGVNILKHKAKTGTALTIEEEWQFLQNIKGAKYELTFIILLYAGMRRGELSSARFENGFVIVKDGKKRLAQTQTERKIPITPMLQRYIDNYDGDLNEVLNYDLDLMSRWFRNACAGHHLHELRHTFITRCQECGVSREVVSVWAGHAADNTMTSNVYTHFSDEFMLAEGKKVDYYNRYRRSPKTRPTEI